jgi:hypothetical protein
MYCFRKASARQEKDMSFAIFHGEKNLADLAARLFKLRGTGSKTAIKQASDALLRANPQLKDIGKLPVGSVIVVPPDAPSVDASQSPAPDHLVRAFAAERTQQLLSVLDTRLAAIENNAGDAAADILKLAKSKQAQAAAANNPTLRAALPAIVKSAQAKIDDSKNSQDERTKAIAEVRSGLEQFMLNQ